MTIINRVEVIDHSSNGRRGFGRIFVDWRNDIAAAASLQDDGRTLKIIIVDKDEIKQLEESLGSSSVFSEKTKPEP